MKIITIRLPDVEAAMLAEVQKVNRAHRDLQGLLISQIQQEYDVTPEECSASTQAWLEDALQKKVVVLIPND